MSHQPERKEKNCLNCGAIVLGRYCQHCGQENIVPKQNVGGLIRHFVYDVFHFDGKFFETLRKLLFKPGFVPKEYVAGRRNSYLDPIRMYLFTSAIFFLVFFAWKGKVNFAENDDRPMTRAERFEFLTELKDKPLDSQQQRLVNLVLDTNVMIMMRKPGSHTNSDSVFNVTMNGKPYQLVAKAEANPEITTNISWFDKKWRGGKIRMQDKYKDDRRAFISQLLEEFIHKMPYMLFVSLPFFALLLKLLYQRRKTFFYSDHAVFTLYHYIFSFLLLLILMLLSRLNEYLGWQLIDYLRAFLLLLGGIYLYKSMRRFYGQRRAKTILKFILLNIFGFVMLMILFIIFFLLSILQF